MKIESKDTDLENLLSGRYFSIPRFQRPYSWDIQNIDDLWEDVTRASGEDYFLGSMVVYPRDRQHYNVVDGQQRLTTLTIFLCAIRDSLESVGEHDLARGLHQFVIRNNRDNLPERVLQAESSFPFFADVIQEFGEPGLACDTSKPEERSLVAAFERLRDLVAGVLASIDVDPRVASEDRLDGKIQALKSLRDSLLQLKLILVTLENEDDAYLIFETLNTRGKDLAVTDLLKNHFARLVKSPGSVDYLSIRWSSMLTKVNDADAGITSDSFLYHYWASRYQSVPLKKLFPAMRKDITKHNAQAYLTEMESDADVYRKINRPTGSFTPQQKNIEQSLKALRIFRVTQPTPAILSLLRAWQTGVIQQKKCAEALGAVEHFHFLFTAVTSSRSSGGISGMYNAFAQRLASASTPPEAAAHIKDLIRKLRSRKPDLEVVLPEWADLSFTNVNSKNRQLVRYILQRLANDSGVAFKEDPDQRNIEHIRPQSVVSDSGDWTDALVGSLGNLLLMDSRVNARLANKTYLQKKPTLLKYDTLPSINPWSVQSVADWTPEVVTERNKELAKMAFESGWHF